MRFRYLRDPLFVLSLVVFAIDKSLLRPLHHPLLPGHLADCLCIPMWVPVVATIVRLIGLRRHDLPPQAGEILIPLLAWSWLFEVVLPQTASFASIATSDPLDVTCYTFGAVVAAAGWRWIYPPATAATATGAPTTPPPPATPSVSAPRSA